MKRPVPRPRNLLRKHGYELALAAALTLIGIAALLMAGFRAAAV